jgi:hypothetical protein
MSRCRSHSGNCDQILLPVGVLLSEICSLLSAGRTLWREDGSAVCSAFTQWSGSHRARNHNLLSHLRLPQPGRPGFRIYIPQEQGGPVVLPGTVWFSQWQNSSYLLIVRTIRNTQIHSVRRKGNLIYYTVWYIRWSIVLTRLSRSCSRPTISLRIW